MQQFCLRWNNHQPNFISVFGNLLSNEILVDVTLAAEGKQLQAHKVVLSACSTYFQSLFTSNPCQHPIVILKDIKFSDLKTMIDFMYFGEVNVSQDQLPVILKTAEALKVKGLADMPEQISLSKSGSQSSADKSESPTGMPSSPTILRRKRFRKSSTGSSEQTSTEDGTGSGGSFNDPNGPLTSSTTTGTTTSTTTTTTTTSTATNTKTGENVENRIEIQGTSAITVTARKSDSTESESATAQPHYEDNVGTVSRNTSEENDPGMRWSSSADDNKSVTSQQSSTQGYYGYGCYESAATPSYSYPPTPQHHSYSSEDSPYSHHHHHHQSPGSTNSGRGRRRTRNPQQDENFNSALEAVRSGGLGFCKAAKIYGVNNRTLWLEYKKRGYPLSRPSTKTKPSPTNEHSMSSNDTAHHSAHHPLPTSTTPSTTSIGNNYEHSYFQKLKLPTPFQTNPHQFHSHIKSEFSMTNGSTATAIPPYNAPSFHYSTL